MKQRAAGNPVAQRENLTAAENMQVQLMQWWNEDFNAGVKKPQKETPQHSEANTAQSSNNIVSRRPLITNNRQVNGQSRLITGTVIAKDDGQPLPGVSIKVRGTSIGTQTNASGAYRLSVPANSTLEFSFIGYDKQVIAVRNRNTINSELTTNSRQLNEVVVTGYAAERKKDVTGSVSVVTANATVTPVADSEKLLQGQLSGVTVQNNSSPLNEVVVTRALGIKRMTKELGYTAASSSGGEAETVGRVGKVTVNNQGQPGASIPVFIRGISSFSDKQPLYVIDGVQTIDMSKVNPNDIQAISLLRDANSTAIYGVAGANGVVIVTTRKNKSRTKPAKENTIAQTPDADGINIVYRAPDANYLKTIQITAKAAQYQKYLELRSDFSSNPVYLF